VAIYSAQAKAAHNLIGKKGTSVAFTREVASTFDPVTQLQTVASTTFSMNGIGIGPGRSAEFRIGSLARRNVIELHLAPNLGTTPRPGDKVRWAAADWSVIWVDALDPAGDGSPYCLCYAER
jgi:hypothetical protein